MTQGRETRPVMICPYRLIEGSQVFLDCIHLLRSHEPGNELRIITALTVPGGSVDYCLVSVREGKPRDFVGHKIATFDHLSKRLVLVLQDCLLSYMRAAFAFDHIQGVRDGDPMHFHAYEPRREPAAYRLQLAERVSTDSLGIARCLGLQAEPKVELQSILDQIAAKLPQSRRLEVVSGAAPPPTPTLAPAVSDE